MTIVLYRETHPPQARCLLPLILALVTALPVARADGQAPVGLPAAPIRLGSVLEEAERANPRLDVARSLASAARARIPTVTRPPDPQLQFGWMNYQLSPLRPMGGLGMSQWQLMQMVPTAGKLRLAGEAATARADAVATRVADVALDVRVRTAMAFYDLYAAEGSLQVASDTRRLLQDIATIADRMYQVGDGRQADVLRATVEVARMQEEIVRMQTMRTVMAARLNALMVRPAETPVGNAVLPVFPVVPATLDSLTRMAEQGRPMILAGKQEVDAADASARLARKEIWPDLLVGVQYGQRPGDMGKERMGSLMIGASLPIFAKSRQYKMREEAGAMRAMAAAELSSMQTETRGAVAERYADLWRARRLGDLYRTAVLPQAEATVGSSRAAYRVGSVPFMTLLDAQMTLNRYRQELFTLEAEEGKAWAELEMLVGRPLVDARSAQPSRSAGEPPK